MAAQTASSSRPLAYVDVDIDDARADYARACQFVECNDLKYALTSKKLSELGGREILAVPEHYANDYEWSSKGRCRAKPQPNCRVVVEIFDDVAPLAAENFLALVRGDRGADKGSGVPLSYEGCPFHRNIKGFVVQGGDIVKGNGSGGASVFGKKFKDEAKGLKLKHGRGALSMGNSGKNANSSQFFFTFAPCPQLDGKHVVFGRVIAGFDVLDAVEATAPPTGETPTVPLRVAACGLFEDGVTAPRGHWAPPSVAAHPNAPHVFVAPHVRVFVVAPPAAAAKVAAALKAGRLEGDVVASPTLEEAEACADDHAVMFLTPAADAAAAKAVADRKRWPLVAASTRARGRVSQTSRRSSRPRTATWRPTTPS